MNKSETLGGIFSLVFVVTVGLSSAAADKRLFLQIGQKEIDRQSFVSEYLKCYPGESVDFVCQTADGAASERWERGGDLLELAIARALRAESEGQVVGILWHGGKAAESTVRCVRDALGSMVPFVSDDAGSMRMMSKLPRCAIVKTGSAADAGSRFYAAWRSVANENIGKYVSRDYTLKVDGRPVEVVATPRQERWKKPGVALTVSPDGRYSYASFTLEGEAEVEVRSAALDLSGAEILPESQKVSPLAAEKGRLVFRMRPGMQLVVEPTGRNRALVLAANPKREDVPTAGGDRLRYFGPGYHRPGFVELKDNERLYLADGAWVEGTVYARGRNITIDGPGVISGAPHAWRVGPPRYRSERGVTATGAVVTMGGENLTIRDVTIFSGWVYNLTMNDATNVVVENVKVIGGRNINDDGIDPCRTRNVVIRNSFVHTQDDCIAPKYWIDGMLVEKCVLWNDCANVVRLGFECEEGRTGLPFRNVTVRDVDVVHMSKITRGVSNFWAWAALTVEAARGQTLENILFEDIRLHECPEDWVFTDVRTRDIKAGGLDSCHGDEAGHIRNLVYRNIHLKKNGRGMVMGFQEHDRQHAIGGLRLENVTGYGPVVGSAALPDEAARGGIAIRCDYPGGNVKVVSVDEASGKVTVAPDLRDTQGYWFHFDFTVTGAAGRSLRFAFPQDGGEYLSSLGPAISRDAGRTWRWLNADGRRHEPANAFDYTFAADETETRFAVSIPYVQKDWDAFVAPYRARTDVTFGTLCKSRSGKRDVEYVKLPCRGRAEWLFVLTARHHACETTGNPPMEGALALALGSSPEAEWLREKADCWFVPFMDKDGVEEGDQGKNRRPYDHNRDYAKGRYPSVRALKDLIVRESAGKRIVFLDLHSPHVRSLPQCPEQDQAFTFGADDPRLDAHWNVFREQWKAAQRGGRLVYDGRYDIQARQGYWNVMKKNWDAGYLSSDPWVRTLPNAYLATCCEFGYSLCGGVNSVPAMRELGGNMFKAAVRTAREPSGRD